MGRARLSRQHRLGAVGADDPPSIRAREKCGEIQRVARSLDTIKQEALQAATGFALSPCDSTMKQNFVEALTAYVRAWQIKLDCPRLANMPMFCGEEKLRAAVAAFSTPLDGRVAAAVAQAFSQPGITIADFSETIRYDMLRFGGPALQPGISPVCEPGLAHQCADPTAARRSVNR